MNAPSRSSWLVPAGLAVVVVGLVSIALLRGTPELDPDTPEGTVQEYLLAVSEERWDEALEIIHPRWRGGCETDDLAFVSVDDFSARLGNDSSGEGLGGGFVVDERFEAIPAVPEPSRGAPDPNEEPLPGGTRFVDVTITHQTGAGLGSNWSEFVVFELLDEDDFWWVVGDPWPYFTWGCRDR